MANFIDKFREFDEGYIELKKEQYTAVALRIHEVMDQMKYGEDEGAFELAKKWLLNNEKFSTMKALIDAGRDIRRDFLQWIPVAVSFTLGALTEQFSQFENFFINPIFWSGVLIIVIVGVFIDMMLRYTSEKIEKLHIRIMQEMSYSEYITLINGWRKTNAEEENKKMKLMNYNQEQYGDEYKNHILEQWKTAVDMSNAISDRRTNVNNIFLSINSILLALITFQFEKKSMGYALIGCMICGIWIINLKNFKQLNSAKFKVINELEKKLPANVFDYEWELIGRGNDGKRYKRMTKIEQVLPFIFILIYIVAIMYPVIAKILIK